MDAVKFIRERRRMQSCGEHALPLSINGCTAEEAVEEVEKWSREHPRKTRQSEFLKQWPEAKKAEDGVLCIRPCFLMADYQKESCKDTYIDEWGSDCYPCVSKFWMQEVD